MKWKNVLSNFFLLLAVLTGQLVFSQVPADSTAADSALLKQVEQQMQSNNQATQQPQQTRSTLSFNPDIGVIGDFQGSYISKGNKNFNAYLNETELSLQANVDPYARADFFLSFARDPETGKYGVEVEEGYLTTLSLPAQLQLKVGKFREAVGRINPTHPHALPFIDLPNAYVNYFGDEGLNDEGASLSWLIPNKKFYQEIVFQATSGLSESPSFYRGDNNRLIYLGHLKNFFTLSDNATLELGLTGITGPNDSSRTTSIAAADLTYKWKPVQMNTYRSVTWQSEFYYGHANLMENLSSNSFGLYSFLQYQLAKRWFLTGRYDYAQKPYDKDIVEQAYSLTAGWYATEFSKIELEGKTTDDNVASRYYQGWLRWIFVIGAHGAHQY
ncbi:MAG TPA: hypothetical protein VGQ53_05060 [Chitinophagaceae bacterium]|jgi:hypothetical protein|nr:hypothetical protein [Chitinophagaceae bacterium]